MCPSIAGLNEAKRAAEANSLPLRMTAITVSVESDRMELLPTKVPKKREEFFRPNRQRQIGRPFCNRFPWK
jgi:hypothetical protein